MAMQFVTLRQQEESAGAVIVTQYWYLTEDKSRVVEEGDPAGRWLWASPGTEVSLRDAIRLGAVKVFIGDDDVSEHVDTDPLAETEPPAGEEPAEEKKARQAPNKARKQGANKAASNGEDK